MVENANRFYRRCKVGSHGRISLWRGHLDGCKSTQIDKSFFSSFLLFPLYAKFYISICEKQDFSAEDDNNA